MSRNPIFAAAVLLPCLTMAQVACDGDPSPTAAAPPMAAGQMHGAQVQGTPAGPTPGVQDIDADVATPRAVYRQAAERARKTITLENAKQKLGDMDAQIEQEKEMAQ